ncbi:hypothetical protein EVA_03448 [gut metagenome]|uniref:Uncharacterized protein n=1 Tax=gut metagenome TaxID=749906 RepID=J9GLU3_9ZZZZ
MQRYLSIFFNSLIVNLFPNIIVSFINLKSIQKYNNFSNLQISREKNWH